MDKVAPPQTGLRQNRVFILSSLSLGHGVFHMFSQGFPLLMTEVAAAMGLGTVQKASLFAMRQAGAGAANLGGGPIVDMMKSHWGLILTGCMIVAAGAFALVGASPNYPILLMAVLLISVPGALWHLPAAAALSQRFPERRGFAISMHGFGSYIGNVVGPLLVGALLGVILWRHIFFIYSGPSLVLAMFVWWSLRDLGAEGARPSGSRLRSQFGEAASILRNPLVAGLILAAVLRGVGLNTLFNWAPFYFKEVDGGLGMGSLEAGFYYSLLIGMGIVSTPILGALSDRVGRKKIIVPGLALTSALSLLVVPIGDSLLLIPALAGIGLFSFAMHQIIQAAVLDIVGTGSEAKSLGLLFGIHGMVGVASPFVASVIIDHMGGYGSIFYYSAILTGITAGLVALLPIRERPRIK